MFNLYKELGVKSDATLKDIKMAYRKKAKEVHPDTKNGDEEKFNRLNQAYKILSNEEQRKYYDEHGTIKDLEESNKAYEIVASLFTNLLGKEVPLHVNYIQLMEKTLKNSIAELIAEEEIIKNNIKRYIKMMKKIKRKNVKDTNIFILVLSNRKEAENKRLSKIESAKNDTIEALKILKDYEFYPDEMSTETTTIINKWVRTSST